MRKVVSCERLMKERMLMMMVKMILSWMFFLNTEIMTTDNYLNSNDRI